MTKNQKFMLAGVSFIVGLLIFALSYLGMKNLIFLGGFNQPVLSWVVGERTEVLTDIAKVVTTAASPPVLVVIVIAVSSAFAFWKRDIWRPTLLIGAIALSSVTSIVLKTIFMDTRPAQINMIPAFETDFSFPSGHTLNAAVFLLVLGYLLYSRNFRIKNMILWLISASVGTVLIATSRLYLGYHWLTDVMASLGLGFMILTITVMVDSLVHNTKAVRQKNNEN